MHRDLICQRCGALYNPNSYSQKWCPACQPIIRLAQRQERKRRENERLKAMRRQRRIDHGLLETWQ